MLEREKREKRHCKIDLGAKLLRASARKVVGFSCQKQRGPKKKKKVRKKYDKKIRGSNKRRKKKIPPITAFDLVSLAYPLSRRGKMEFFWCGYL